MRKLATEKTQHRVVTPSFLSARSIGHCAFFRGVVEYMTRLLDEISTESMKIWCKMTADSRTCMWCQAWRGNRRLLPIVDEFNDPIASIRKTHKLQVTVDSSKEQDNGVFGDWNRDDRLSFSGHFCFRGETEGLWLSREPARLQNQCCWSSLISPHMYWTELFLNC